jgi:hypothetical protein
MVLAERIPNGLVIDVGERLKRLPIAERTAVCPV